MSLGKYHALIIYVQDYEENTLDLRFPERDAKALKQVLEDKYVFESIELLANPTRRMLLRSLRAFEQLSENDNLLIFFAGHGFFEERIDQGYWWPSDAVAGEEDNWISNSDIRDRLRGIHAKNILLISDACFSGGIFQTRSGANNQQTAEIKNQYKSRRAMTSGVLKEVPDDSAFLKYLVQRLEQNKEAYLGSFSLFASLQNAVVSNSRNVPQYGVIFDVGDEGGEFIFVSKNASTPNHQEVETDSSPLNELALSDQSVEILQKHKSALGIHFVLLPAGEYQRGSAIGKDDEKPVHRVSISQPFYIGQYEVTQAQWKAVMQNNPSQNQGDTRPVDSVSWEDVQVFLDKLNEMEGCKKCYRLPTEAEWEYACRAGGEGEYTFGDNASELKNYAWFGDFSGTHHVIGEKLPNDWELYDIHGNVAEWVQDGYDASYYSRSLPLDPAGPKEAALRVLRGGNYEQNAHPVRCASRGKSSPDARFAGYGFRLVKDL